MGGKQARPRASKVVVSWQRKQEKPTVVKATTPKKKIRRSKHPLVKMLNEIEEDGPLDPDLRVAIIAGFQAAHCTPEKFHADREIARIRLSTGEIKKTYACDVCGFVGSKLSQG